MRSFLRVLFTLALLLWGGGADWAPGAPAAACCCGCAVGVEEACPCPKPENSRSRPAPCSERVSPPAAEAPRAEAAEVQRREPRPEPPAVAAAGLVPGARVVDAGEGSGRDPDLGRHLARLRRLRI